MAVQQIIAHDYWTDVPLSYLANGCPGLSVSVLIDLDCLRVPYAEGRYAAHEDWLRGQLQDGAYVVEQRGIPVPLGGKVIERVLSSSFAPGSIRLVGAIEPEGIRIFKLDRHGVPEAPSPLIRVGARSQ